MIIELGHFALILAFCMAFIQCIIPLIGAERGDVGWMNVARPCALIQAALIIFSFAALMYAFVTSDFSVVSVVENSHSAKPMLYKISGVWGNHEGSMVLWVLILSVFGAMVALFGTALAPSFKARVLGVQGALGAAFLLFIITTSNPFRRVFPAPVDGNGLNPLLQDPGLAFHPPFLYLGYVGFSVTFAFAVAALLEGQVNASWARWVRPWTLGAWAALTVGIALGSYWAYYELGWGGWWFWDPVENASLMPWLAGTALLHSSVVTEKRGVLKSWSILLAILAFSLSLLGTFLVRSGVLTSVHAFAVDPRRGIFVLLILAVFVGGSLTLYALRAPLLKADSFFAPISREGGLVLNNLLLTVAAATVLIGTLYPLILEGVGGGPITVGPPFFNMTFGPLMVALLVIMPFGPMLAWKRADLLGAAQRLWWAGLLAAVTVLTVLTIVRQGPYLAALGIGLGVWLICGAIAEWTSRIKLFSEKTSRAWARARNLPRSAYGTALGHAGMGVLVLGITGVSAWRVEKIEALAPGQSMNVAGYNFQLESIAKVQGPNYWANRAVVQVTQGENHVVTLYPEKRSYPVAGMATTEAAIYTHWISDLYVVLGDRQGTPESGAWAVRVYRNPLVDFIWIGAIIMALGGMISLSDRRLRIGLPARRRVVPPSAPLPAE